MSLGVDLVTHKICSLDCVYCECGKTNKLTTGRMEYVKLNKIKEELRHFFANNPDPDYITFSGSGEPTLNIKIGKVLDFIKEIKPGISVALLTNGTLLNNKDLRREILRADLVLPSLDAATQDAFEKINRPAPGLSVDDHINGLIEFRKEYRGEIWLEILIIPGYNDNDNNIGALSKALSKIKPDRIQLNTLDRPGTEKKLRNASRAELKNIGKKLDYPNIEIITAPVSRKKIEAYRSDTETAILETIQRRPCTAVDLSQILGLHLNEVNKYLDVLDSEKKIRTRNEERGIFYQPREKSN